MAFAFLRLRLIGALLFAARRGLGVEFGELLGLFRAAATRCEVLLRRRSLLAFSREAYTECTHEIGASPDTIGLCCVNLDAANARVGDVVGRAGERVSFTLRYASGAE